MLPISRVFYFPVDGMNPIVIAELLIGGGVYESLRGEDGRSCLVCLRETH
jgi:hypothetical protein